MLKQLVSTGGGIGSVGAGLALLHGPALVILGVAVGVLLALFVVWVLAITFSAAAADNWAKWRAAGARLGPGP